MNNQIYNHSTSNSILSQLKSFVHKHSSNLEQVFLRLPSLIAADLILLNSDYIIDRLKLNTDLFNYIAIYFISKFVLLSLLFVCLLIFTLNSNYVLRIYKLFALVSLPFIFTKSIDYVHTNRFNLLQFEFRYFPVCLIYSITMSLTVLLYYDLYLNCIIDKQKIHRYYQIYKSRGEEQHFLELLFKQGYGDLHTIVMTDQVYRFTNADRFREFTFDQNLIEDKSWFSENKRQFFIIGYFFLSLILNETEFIIDNTEDKFNLISLGYLLLLMFDLSVNLDQMLLRLLLQIKMIGRVIAQYGLSNFISHNWFKRLKVPFVLRVYFCLKVFLLTFNFVLYYNYYLGLDLDISIQNKSNDSKSLYNFLTYLFKPKNSSQNITSNSTLTILNDYDKDEFLFESIWSQFVSIFSSKSNINETKIEDLNFFKFADLYVKVLVLNLTNTLVSISCTTSILSYQYHLLGQFVNGIITSKSGNEAQLNTGQPAIEANNQLDEHDADIKNVGDVAAILFFLLSIQSGLSSLSGKQRIEKFLKNYSLLFIAILHYFHTSLDAQLMTLSASSRLTWSNKKHVRILNVCISLVLIPALIIIVIWRYFNVSTWLLAATAFNIELIVKMIVSFMLYILFLIDSKSVNFAFEKISKNSKKNDDVNKEEEIEEEYSKLSDKLDDYIYYVKGFGHVFEFIVALFLFFNGGYILIFESYGAIRAIMMCIHAYFHIWCQARKGWSVFIKRRTAIGKLKNLNKFDKASYVRLKKRQKTELTASEIKKEFEEKRNDVCPICFCELSAHEALITNCNHIFHFICLRKWLYLQDTCPMCHQLVYQTPSTN